MKYRRLGKTGAMVSALGFGAMRLPTKDGAIDHDEAVPCVRRAIDGGVNYVDTAYIYHGGKSETFLKSALSDGYRQKVFLADKSPVWMLKKAEDFDRVLEEQLERLGVDCIDMYLLHSLSRGVWENKVRPYGLLEKMRKAKADGLVKHIGFSFHDDFDAFKMMVDEFEDCEFCQIQFNYVDTDRQAGSRGLLYAAERDLGIIIMEPLLGGRLANPAANLKKHLPADQTPVEFGLNFIWSYPQVGTVLSGMSTMDQVEENLILADKSGAPIGPDGLAVYENAKKVFETAAIVPCTACAYCMPCPAGVDIPQCFKNYNLFVADRNSAIKAYEKQQGRGEMCVGCRRCEEHCPQHIEISSHMKKLHEVLTGPLDTDL